MKRMGTLTAFVLAIAGSAAAQVSTHGTMQIPKQQGQQVAPLQVTDKPVARVNGAVLTDRDLLREMYQIFPYAKQHNGFPKAEEASIRQGALQMIIFEELVYQEAVRRKMTVTQEQMKQGETEFKKQFSSPGEYKQFLQVEMKGSEQVMRERMKRSLLIEQLLKVEVENKSVVTLAEEKAYYDKNLGKFQLPETFTFQAISFLPPANAKPEQLKEEAKRAQEALAQAKKTTNYQEFGLLAEKVSEDDFRVNMGDHKVVAKDKLPPQVVKAFSAMKTGQVSDVIQIEQAYTIIRLNAYTPGRKQTFEEVKKTLRPELQKQKYEKLRSDLDKQLRAKSKVEVL
jgi:peptidyl-prolyl cis-trans isomerase SurA